MGLFSTFFQDTRVAYGGIHVHDNSVSQSIPNGAGYEKIINFADNDPSNNTTPDATNDQITIGISGVYKLDSSFSFSSGTANVIWQIAFFLDGVEVDSIHLERKTSSSGDVGSASCSGLLQINAGQVIDIRASHDNGSAVNFTGRYMNFCCNRVKLDSAT
jgi:hypothetical protein